MSVVSNKIIYCGSLPIIPTFDPEHIITEIQHNHAAKYDIKEIVRRGKKSWQITFKEENTQLLLNQARSDSEGHGITQLLKQELSEPFDLTLSPYGILELTKKTAEHLMIPWYLELLQDILDSFLEDLYNVIANVQKSYPTIFRNIDLRCSAIIVDPAYKKQKVLDALYQDFQAILHTVFIDAIRVTRNIIKDSNQKLMISPKILPPDIIKTGHKELENSLDSSHKILEKCEFIEEKSKHLSTILLDETGILRSVGSQCNMIQYRMNYVSKKIEQTLQSYSTHTTISSVVYPVFAFGVGTLITGIFANHPYQTVSIIAGSIAIIFSVIFGHKNDPRKNITHKVSDIKAELESMLDLEWID